VGERADAQGSLSLSHASACNPLLQAHPPWAQDNTKAAVSPWLVFPPFVLRLAPTHLGWDTQRQFTRRSRDPRGRNADKNIPTGEGYRLSLQKSYYKLGP
jgi:hypothetical protein